jgi:type IX secretion system PorP/SprF family membrane protein
MKTFLTITCVLTAGLTFSQQAINTTQFWNTNLHNNPAVAGLQYKHAAHALYRNQWDGVNGAPNALFVNYAARVDRIHGAAGVSYTYDVIGFNRQHEVLGHYAFHLPVGERNIFSGGISGGILDFSTKAGWTPPNTMNDPMLPESSSNTEFTMNAGIAFHAPRWNAGFSCSYLNAPTIRLKSIAGSEVSYTAARHYWLFADYTFDLGEHIHLRPQVQLLTDAVKHGHNASVMVLVKNFWGGINFSFEQYAGLMVGYDFYGKYRVGYSYDYTTNQLSSVSRGTHEIVLAYLLRQREL